MIIIWLFFYARVHLLPFSLLSSYRSLRAARCSRIAIIILFYFIFHQKQCVCTIFREAEEEKNKRPKKQKTARMFARAYSHTHTHWYFVVVVIEDQEWVCTLYHFQPYTNSHRGRATLLCCVYFLALPIRWWDVDDDDDQTLVSAKTAVSNKIDDEWTHDK